MKKIAFTLCIVAVGLLAACQSSVVSDENFTIEVKNIKDRQVSIRIVPSDKQAYYYWDVQTTEWYNEHKDSLGEYYKQEWDYDIEHGLYEPEGEGESEGDDDDDENNTNSGAWGTYEYFLVKGIDSDPEFDALMPATEYIVFAYYPDEQMHAVNPTTMTFKTANPEMLQDLNIYFLANLSHNPDKLTITASLGGEPLFFGSVTTAELGKMSVEKYAQQLFEQCMSAGGEQLEQHTANTQVILPMPEEPTFFFACSYYGTTRTSRWFTYQTTK